MILSLLFASGCTRAEPLRYVLEDDFTGWVAVEVAVPGLPDAPVKTGRREVDVDTTGRARTGSGFGAGPASFVTRGGRRLPVLEDEGVGYDEAHLLTRDTPFVCCRGNGTLSAQGEPERSFERFYVGHGPAGDAPPWAVED